MEVKVHYSDGRARKGEVLSRVGDQVKIKFADNGREEIVIAGLNYPDPIIEAVAPLRDSYPEGFMPKG